MKVMKKSISLALILLGYTVAIPAVQAEGYEYYSNQGALVYGSNFGDKRKSLPSLRELTDAICTLWKISLASRNDILSKMKSPQLKRSTTG